MSLLNSKSAQESLWNPYAKFPACLTFEGVAAEEPTKAAATTGAGAAAAAGAAAGAAPPCTERLPAVAKSVPSTR